MTGQGDSWGNALCALKSSDGLATSAGGARYRARLFGTFSLAAPDGTDVTPPGRKARALLAHLLTAPGEDMLRDRLAALLWSQRADQQARASLRQTLHELRSLTVGDQALIVQGRRDVRVARDRVTTDVDDLLFGACAGAGPALSGVVGGRLPELLSDLNDIDPAFDEWLSAERRRRGDALRGVALGLAEQALQSGDADRADRLSSMLLATDPIDEAAARCAMLALHRRGNKDGVRLAHTRLVAALQAELGVAPAPETTELHRSLMVTPEPVPHAAARPIAVSAAMSAAVDVGLPPQGAAGLTMPAARRALWRKRGRWDRRAAALTAMAAVAVALALVGAARLVAWRSGAAAAQRVLAVEALLVPANDGAARTLDRGLSTDLARMIVGNDAVLSVSDAAHGGSMPATSAAPDYILAGDAQSEGGMLHANVQLRRGDDATAAIIWSHAYTRAAAEVDALREQIATNVADVAVCALGGNNPGVDELGAETMRLYLAACEQKHGDYDEAKKLLTQVVARRPGFARGWAMLAAATAVSVDERSDQADALRRQADAEARRAIALSSSEGDAYFAQAITQPGVAHWATRMAILQTGHAANPTNPAINATLATELASVGRGREALDFIQRGWAFDPFSPVKAAMLARWLAFSGDVDGANAMLRLARKRFPTSDDVARMDFWLAALVGDAHHAVDMLADPQRGFEMLPARVARWRPVLAAQLDPSPAKVNAAIEALLNPAIDPNSRGTHLLADLVRLNRTDLAFAQAQQMTPAELEDDTDVLFSTVTAPLRADPRFMALAARAGLASIWRSSGRWPDFCRDPLLPYDCRTEMERVQTAPALASGHPGA